MRRIVLFEIAALVVTVGAHHWQRLVGVGEPGVVGIMVGGVAAYLVCIMVNYEASRIRYRYRWRWTFGSYAIGIVTTVGALVVGTVGLSLAIAFAGVFGILAIWLLASRLNPEERLALTPHSNGA